MTDEVDKIYVVKSTARARAAIREQVRYITVDQNSPQNAATWLDRVWTRIDGLELMPQRYPNADGYDQVPYVVRRVVLDNHLILFTVDDSNAIVYVVGLRHGSRLPQPNDLPFIPRDDDAR